MPWFLLLLLLGSCSAVVTTGEISRKAPLEEATPLANPVPALAFDRASIESVVVIVRDRGYVDLLRGHDAAWMNIVPGASRNIPAPVVDRLLDRIEAMSCTHRTSYRGTAGFDPPRMTISIHERGADSPESVWIGNPIGEGLRAALVGEKSGPSLALPATVFEEILSDVAPYLHEPRIER